MLTNKNNTLRFIKFYNDLNKAQLLSVTNKCLDGLFSVIKQIPEVTVKLAFGELKGATLFSDNIQFDLIGEPRVEIESLRHCFTNCIMVRGAFWKLYKSLVEGQHQATKLKFRQEYIENGFCVLLKQD